MAFPISLRRRRISAAGLSQIGRYNYVFCDGAVHYSLGADLKNLIFSHGNPYPLVIITTIGFQTETAHVGHDESPKCLQLSEILSRDMGRVQGTCRMESEWEAVGERQTKETRSVKKW